MHTATVVGAGPAGLIAAEVLAEAGIAVTLYDQRRSFGRKFLLAGRGGLNMTHSEPSQDFVRRYRDDDAQLRMKSLIEGFGPGDLRTWSAGLGQPTFAGSSGRVFPEAFRATPLLRAWLARLDELDVSFRPRHRWTGISSESPPTQRFVGPDDKTIEVRPDVAVLALGGASWPRVGGDGSWVEPVIAADIGVNPLEPTNCGVQVSWTSMYRDRFEGEPLKNVALTADGTTIRGDCVVTRLGLEGGPVYAHSATLRTSLRKAQTSAGPAVAHPLTVDLLPDLSREQVIERLQKRRPKESTSSWLRKVGLAPIAVGLLREATANKLPERLSRLASLIKAVPVAVTALMPIDRAISSAGGIRFDEVDERLMLAKVPGVFVAGEMLDWEAPTGGYLLQGCFSTGVAAARGALEYLG